VRRKNVAYAIGQAICVFVGVWAYLYYAPLPEYLADFPIYITASFVAGITTFVSFRIITLCRKYIDEYDSLIRLVLGSEYIAGYYEYEYLYKSVTRRGYWHINQKLDDIQIVGIGLDQKNAPRSRAISFAVYQKHGPGLRIIGYFRREFLKKPTESAVSRTRLVFQNHEASGITAEGNTLVIGGKDDGQEHKNLKLRRCKPSEIPEDVKTALDDARMSASEWNKDIDF
jgi:hypothetical protein